MFSPHLLPLASAYSRSTQVRRLTMTNKTFYSFLLIHPLHLSNGEDFLKLVEGFGNVSQISRFPCSLRRCATFLAANLCITVTKPVGFWHWALSSPLDGSGPPGPVLGMAHCLLRQSISPAYVYLLLYFTIYFLPHQWWLKPVQGSLLSSLLQIRLPYLAKSNKTTKLWCIFKLKF